MNDLAILMVLLTVAVIVPAGVPRALRIVDATEALEAWLSFEEDGRKNEKGNLGLW
jgi:hypothetical protein